MSLEARLVHRAGSFSLDVSLHVGEGLTVLFGPSGSGKSLTLQLLGGLRRLDAGYIRRNDVTIATGSGVHLPPEKRALGMVFQDLALFPHLTVEENILFGVSPQKRPAAREWIGRVELEGMERRYPHELSGGQRQRVALARALAPEPELLLMDEPFSALDGPLRSRMRREIKRLQRETGIPVLYVTHSVEDLGVLADQVVFLRKGRDIAFIQASRLWNGHACGDIWHALGWGTVLEGKVEHAGGATWFLYSREQDPLMLPPRACAPGRAGIFLPPHRIHVLDPQRPVEPELHGGLMRGRVQHLAYLRGRCSLGVDIGDKIVDVDVPEEHAERLKLEEGAAVVLGIRSDAIAIMPRKYDNGAGTGNLKGAVVVRDSLEQARNRLAEELKRRNLNLREENIAAEPLGVEDAIGDPSPYKDFPLMGGDEKLMEVRFRQGRGQAFSGCPSRWHGTVGEVFDLPLENERDRGLCIATLNAITSELDLAEKTVHCKDSSPDECALQIADYLWEKYGADQVVGIVGYHPAIIRRVSERFGPENVRVTDLNPKNVGFERFGVEIWHGERDLERLGREATLALVTGSALSNGSFDSVWDTLKEHEVPSFCFGTTIAGIASLLEYPRLCFEAS